VTSAACELLLMNAPLIVWGYVVGVDRSDHLTALWGEAAAFQAALGATDLSAPVPTCGDWDLRALAVHLAGVHRWARNAVAEQELRKDPTPPLPDRAAVVDWCRTSAERLLDALQTAPAGTVCPGLEPGPHNVEWWIRRQAHETAVHRYDAEIAAGITPRLSPHLSTDGVQEVVHVLVPRQRRLGRLQPLPHGIVLARTDGDERWSLGGGQPVAEVHATAATLLLLLWGRVTIADAQVDGDRDAVRRVLAYPLTP
jgi:uncharacterized protein (TIGR03083 family)